VSILSTPAGRNCEQISAKASTASGIIQSPRLQSGKFVFEVDYSATGK
jgi:hypothetical protein